MATDKALQWSFVEEFPLIPVEIAAATQAALECGVSPISPSAGSLLRTLVNAAGAKSVLEVGTGLGVSGLWILGGLAPSGVLTTIDIEGEYHKLARRAFTAAGITPAQLRMINGRAGDILPRMAPLAYDAMVLDGEVLEVQICIEHAKRLLRRGGLLVVLRALWNGNVADPARRDEASVTMRQALASLREDPDFQVSLVSIADGVALAVKL